MQEIVVWKKSSHAMLDPCSLFFLLLFIPLRLVTNLNKKKNSFKSFHHTMFKHLSSKKVETTEKHQSVI